MLLPLQRLFWSIIWSRWLAIVAIPTIFLVLMLIITTTIVYAQHRQAVSNIQHDWHMAVHTLTQLKQQQATQRAVVKSLQSSATEQTKILQQAEQVQFEQLQVLQQIRWQRAHARFSMPFAAAAKLLYHVLQHPAILLERYQLQAVGADIHIDLVMYLLQPLQQDTPVTAEQLTDLHNGY